MYLTKEEILLLYGVIFSYINDAQLSDGPALNQLEELAERFKDCLLSAGHEEASYDSEPEDASKNVDAESSATTEEIPDDYMAPEILAVLDSLTVKHEGERETSLEFEMKDGILDLVLDYTIEEDVRAVKLDTSTGFGTLYVKTEEWMTFELIKKLPKSWRKAVAANVLFEISTSAQEEDYSEDE